MIRCETSGGAFAARTSVRVRVHVAPSFASSARWCSSQSARSVTVAIQAARVPRFDRQKSTRESRVPSAVRAPIVCLVCSNRSARRSLSGDSSWSIRLICALERTCSSRERKKAPTSSARRATSAIGIVGGDASAETFCAAPGLGGDWAPAGDETGAPERRSAHTRSASAEIRYVSSIRPSWLDRTAASSSTGFISILPCGR